MMSGRATKWFLWLVFLLTLPVPYFMIEVGLVPTARLFVFAGLTIAVALTEPSFEAIMIASLFAIQSLLFGAVLYFLARGVSRALMRLQASKRTYAFLAIVVVLFGLSLFSVFRTPLSNRSATANLFGLLQ